MRAIILAAGEGVRLLPHTIDRPKCLVSLAGRPLLAWQIDALGRAGIDDITVVTGYRADMVAASGVRTVHNPRFHDTNMVASLLCARGLLDGSDDVLVCYGDLVYESRLIEALAASAAPIAVTVDRQWRRLWDLRMADPLADAETLRVDGGHVIELGRKPTRLDEIQGQYMGLIGVKSNFAPRLVLAYDALEPLGPYGGHDRDHMFMTSFLQHLIDHVTPVAAVFCHGGWLEVDTTEDLATFEALSARGRLGRYCVLEPVDMPQVGHVRPCHRRLFEMLAEEAPRSSVETAAISLTALVKGWLDAGPAVLRDEQRVLLEAVCRQIDVKKKLSETYGENWKAITPDRPAHPAILGGLVAVLSANGWSEDSGDKGWRLKCANSALKALDLLPKVPHGPALRAWAIEILDRICGAEGADP